MRKLNVLRFFSAVMILFVCIPGAYPEDAEGSGAVGDAAPQKKILSEPVQPADGNTTLYERTMQIDIQTATYYELAAWCKRLGIPAKGTREEMQTALYSHYGITRPSKKNTAEGKQITIESANKSEYFTIERINEDYISLQGDVEVRLEDAGKNTVHQIRAQRILFNQSENIINATGNVEYKLINSGKEEVFRGDSLTFKVDTWEGVFYNGVSQTEQKVNDNTVTFRYYGSKIYRGADNVISLDEGRITSSKEKEPYYEIRAKKIWVLAPGEWAIFNASLFVGKVPVVYIPFFFKNGDKLFFNPSLGFRNEEGFFMQTTTYFLGSKADEEGSFSFMQVGTMEENKKKTIKGLYLREGGDLTEADSKKQTFYKKTGSYGKFMLDYYTRLGLFAGVDMKLSQLGVLKDFSLYAALAFSRDIYISPETGWYSPFWSRADGKVASRWNTTWIGGLQLPLRFGLENSINIAGSFYSLTGTIELYSDPYFLRDFSRRNESMNWGNIFGLTTDNQGALTVTTLDSLILTSTKWNLTGTLTPDLKVTSPYLDTAKIDNAKIEINWKTKDRDTDGISGLDSSLGGYVNESARTDFSFPEKRFFYPENVLLPSISGQIAGTIFESAEKKNTASKNRAAAEKDFPGKGIRPPWEENGDEEDQAAGGASGTGLTEKVPDSQPAIKLPAVQSFTPFSHKLSYKIIPSFSFDNRMDSDLWTKQEDIDFSPAYSLLLTKGTLDLHYQAGILDKTFLFDNTVQFSGQLKKHLNRSDTVSDDTWTLFQSEDNQANNFKLKDLFALTSYPFLTVSSLSKTNIKYVLNTTLFQNVYSYTDGSGTPVYSNTMAKWDPDYILNHTAAMNVVWNTLENDQSFTFSYILPPLDQEIATQLRFISGPVVSQVDWKITENDNGVGWTPQPINLREKLVLSDVFTFQQLFSFNFEYYSWERSISNLSLSFFDGNIKFSEDFIFGPAQSSDIPDSPTLFQNPYSSVTSLKLWWLQTTFTAKKTNLYDLDLVNGWIQKDEQEFVPESLLFSFKIDQDFGPYWHNRIKLSLKLDTSWNMNLIRFSENTLSFDLGFNLWIYQFLEFNFKIQSANEEMYRYFEGPCTQLGIQRRSLIQDLLKSLNIFSVKQRSATFFNAKKISVSAVHHLKDWDLTIKYIGNPELRSDSTGIQYYAWAWSLSFYVQWNPIPELKKQVVRTDEQWEY